MIGLLYILRCYHDHLLGALEFQSCDPAMISNFRIEIRKLLQKESEDGADDDVDMDEEFDTNNEGNMLNLF